MGYYKYLNGVIFFKLISTKIHLILGHGKNNTNNKITNVRVDALIIVTKFYYKYNMFTCVTLIYAFHNI